MVGFWVKALDKKMVAFWALAIALFFAACSKIKFFGLRVVLVCCDIEFFCGWASFDFNDCYGRYA